MGDTEPGLVLAGYVASHATSDPTGVPVLPNTRTVGLTSSGMVVTHKVTRDRDATAPGVQKSTPATYFQFPPHRDQALPVGSSNRRA
jgi:hypothetical protein